MRQLRTHDEADAAFREEVALLYKHSTRCPVSLMAHEEVERFRQAHPEVPVYLVDVVLGRPVSRHVAERTRVVHHSPQAILLRGGEPAWDASHFGITAEALEQALAAAERQAR
ncbi:MAG TPA: bacillithiol system redox-active protein YtxJ [Longimicrobiaceae bacterium]|nr:bacillithiol system redox-active protein YtxJ [Longimicrobiaceae bacterium]